MTETVDRSAPTRDVNHMDTDDIAPPPRAGDPLALLVKLDLDPYSVAELDARLVALEAEIVRTRAKRDKAVNHRASADALFGR
jgi:uncharacterized small protein (DUF1192 family)